MRWMTRAVDRVLWKFVVRRWWFVQTTFVLSMVIPLLVASVVSRGVSTAGILEMYIGSVVACTVLMEVMMGSRERWLMWSYRVRIEEARNRLPGDAKGVRR